MDENTSQQSNENLLMRENLQYHSESTTKLARTDSAWGTEAGCSTGEECWKYFCILALVLIYESKMDQN